ncbi:hypothetical protein [Flammeovirga sp. SubArs3]|uniref:hypothetical protein n=1 Tax=Flammeovirga sp. SubArs3 TaxID=2995316 RepID=UPI00248D3833|nr:hypothetical protein [Flammeovirga sp. SubArs3]
MKHYYLLLLFITNINLCLGNTTNLDYRNWLGTEGNIILRGKLLASDESKVFVEKLTGEITTITLTDLSINDLEYIMVEDNKIKEMNNRVYQMFIHSKWLIVFSFLLLFISLLLMYHAHGRYRVLHRSFLSLSGMLFFIASTSSSVDNFDTYFNYYTSISNQSDLNKELISLFPSQKRLYAEQFEREELNERIQLVSFRKPRRIRNVGLNLYGLPVILYTDNASQLIHHHGLLGLDFHLHIDEINEDRLYVDNTLKTTFVLENIHLFPVQ